MKKIAALLVSIMIIFPSWCQEFEDAHESDTLTLEVAEILLKRELVRVPFLKEHRFVNSRLVIDPFIKTSFRMNVGIGNSNEIDIPLFNIGDTTLSISGSLLYANLIFTYNQRIKAWVSFYITTGLSLRVGADAGSLLLDGLNTLSETDIGWKLRLYHSKHHYLALRVGISNFVASYTNIYTLIQSITTSSSGLSLTENIPALQGDFGLHYALGMGSLLGLQLEVNYNYGDSFKKDRIINQFSFGGAFDLNLYPATKVPVGFSAGYGYTTLPEITNVEDTQSNLYNLKLSYTGSPDLVIGVEVTGNQNPLSFQILEGNEKIEAFVINYSLGMVYYFN
jgi:hypothetical protein